MDPLVEGVSHDDPPPSNSEDEPVKEMIVHDGRETTKLQIAWMYSPLDRDVGVRTIAKCLHKRRNMDFLLGKSDV